MYDQSPTNPSPEWSRRQDVPILITPPQDECIPHPSTYDARSSLKSGAVLNRSFPDPLSESHSLGELKNACNPYFDLSDPECDLSGYGSAQPSPLPSPLQDTFGFEDETNSFPAPCRRGSFAYSDTSELNSEINNLFIQELTYTNFPNISTDTLSPHQPIYTGRSRSASMSVLQTPQLSGNSFFTSPSYTDFNPLNHGFSDLPSATHSQGLPRSRANSMSALSPHPSMMPVQSTEQPSYNLFSENYIPSASSSLEQFNASFAGSVESLPALSSSYGSYQSHGYHLDSNSSSTEFLSMDDSTPGLDHFHHSSVLSYNLPDLSTYPYPVKSKRSSRSHICHFCQRPFTRKHDLHRHIRVHTGDKPYKCGLCGKTFARTDALKRHYRVDEECGKAHEANDKSKEELGLAVEEM